MFTALTLSLSLGAPVPPPSAPVPLGVAPQVMELKANADGKVVVMARRTEKVQIGNGANPAGGAAPVGITRERIVPRQVELGEVKDLTVTTADGKKVSTEDAVKKIASGAIVVVSGDGKPVSPASLKVFKDDTLVLVSPELAGTAAIRPGIRPLPVELPGGPGGIQILPIQPGNVQVLPVQGGVIQVEIAPAVLPVAPPPAPQKVPPKNDK